MDLQLDGAAGIVTGGSGGLGSAIAAALCAEGAAVVIAGRTNDTLAATCSGILAAQPAAEVSAIVVDTDVGESVDAMVAAVEARHGKIEFLVNCAARPGLDYIRDRPGIATFDEAVLHSDIETKVLGYIRCIRAVAPLMTARSYGRIVNVSGLSARRTSSITGSVRNVAVAAMTKNVADELGGHGINVTVVHPGLTVTDGVRAAFSAIGERERISTEDVSARYEAATSIGRLVTAEEVASVVTFLCSPLSVSINGDAIACGGGDRGAIHY